MMPVALEGILGRPRRLHSRNWTTGTRSLRAVMTMVWLLTPAALTSSLQVHVRTSGSEYTRSKMCHTPFSACNQRMGLCWGLPVAPTAWTMSVPSSLLQLYGVMSSRSMLPTFWLTEKGKWCSIMTSIFDSWTGITRSACSELSRSARTLHCSEFVTKFVWATLARKSKCFVDAKDNYVQLLQPISLPNVQTNYNIHRTLLMGDYVLKNFQAGIQYAISPPLNVGHLSVMQSSLSIQEVSLFTCCRYTLVGNISNFFFFINQERLHVC